MRGKEIPKKYWKKDSFYHKLLAGLKCVGYSVYASQPDKVVATCEQHSPDINKLFARMKSMQ